MERDEFSTPFNRSTSYNPFAPTPSTATKRDSLVAELERDPKLSTAKRQQRSQVLSSTMAQANLERKLVAAHTTKMELETKLREKELIIERLERDRRWFADREKEEREEKEKERAEYEREKRRSDQELRALRDSLSILREEHADLQDAHSTLSRNTAQTIATQKSQIATISHQLGYLEEELAQMKQLAEERGRTIEELREQFDELSSVQDALERKDTEAESMKVVREELYHQAGYLRSLESTNAKLTSEVTILRERNTSVEVLREEKRGLERKVKMMEELREKIVKLEAEVLAGRREREAWAKENMAESSTPSKTPVSITRSLSELRLAHARLLEEHGSTVASLRRREAEVSSLEALEAEMRGKMEKSESDCRELKDQILRKEQRVIVAEREVGFLRTLVAGFNAEHANEEETSINEAQTKRIEQLEALLEEFKTVNNQLACEIDALGGDSSTLGHGHTREELASQTKVIKAEKEQMQQALESFESESKAYLEKIDELEQSLFELSGEIAGGRHVPPKTRVLSLKDNPEQQWFDLRQAAMNRLKSENEALMKRLKELEESGARTGGQGGLDDGNEELVPRESWELVNREKQELEDVVKQKEKRLLRLQQIFSSKSAEFREAIASILGVKLAFYPNGQVRVTSIYDLCASFVFQPINAKQGGEGQSVRMQLVAQGEGGPQDLPNLMHYWIENEQCIPGFLASVTLECYENSKRQDAGR